MLYELGKMHQCKKLGLKMYRKYNSNAQIIICVDQTYSR